MVLNIKKITITLLVFTTVFSAITGYGQQDQYVKTMDYGGNGGGSFEWRNDHAIYKLREVHITTGGAVDTFKMVFYHGEQKIESPVFGHPGPHNVSWIVPEGEYITQIIVYSGNLVDSLTFVTNKGTTSPRMGGNGGGKHVIDIPQHYQIGGVYGRSGRSVDKIGFYLQKNDACTGIYEEKNYLCNGGFEDPQLPSGWKYFKDIPCWKGDNVFEVGKGSVYGLNFYSQVIQLDANAGNKKYWQVFDLPYDGDYVLKFEYGARAGISYRENSFHVVFNGNRILTVEPDSRDIREITIKVSGVKGANKVQFWDNDYKKRGHGGILDNVGVYATH